MSSRPKSKESAHRKKGSTVSSARGEMVDKLTKKSARNDYQSLHCQKMFATTYQKYLEKPLSAHHSRKLSTRKDSLQKPSIAKHHIKSNSTTLRPQNIKNTFKIDLSSLIPKQTSVQLIAEQRKPYDKFSFAFKFALGSGGFGRVWSVELKKTGKKYAMKEMLKTKIIRKNSIESVLEQLKLLTQLHHPFIINIFCAFHDKDNLYLVLDHLTGGDLRYHLNLHRKKKFKEGQLKFILACCILGIQYLHKCNVVHRDIKPENFVFDKRGFVRLTDLGIARTVRPFTKPVSSGTPGYMAPEVMIKQDHGFPVDYYALGIIAYEAIIGRRPYEGNNRQEILESILKKQIEMQPEHLPKGWGVEVIDLVNRLIMRKPNDRLGFDGINEIKNHPWFSGFMWEKLLKKDLEPPYVPNSIALTANYQSQITEITNQQIDQQTKLLLMTKQKQSQTDVFESYSYSPPPPPAIQTKESKEKGLKEKKFAKKNSTGGTTTGTHSIPEDIVYKKHSKKSIFFQ